MGIMVSEIQCTRFTKVREVEVCLNFLVQLVESQRMKRMMTLMLLLKVRFTNQIQMIKEQVQAQVKPNGLKTSRRDMKFHIVFCFSFIILFGCGSSSDLLSTNELLISDLEYVKEPSQTKKVRNLYYLETVINSTPCRYYSYDINTLQFFDFVSAKENMSFKDWFLIMNERDLDSTSLNKNDSITASWVTNSGFMGYVIWIEHKQFIYEQDKMKTKLWLLTSSSIINPMYLYIETDRVDDFNRFYLIDSVYSIDCCVNEI